MSNIPTPILVVVTENPLVGDLVTLDLSGSYASIGTIKKWTIKWGDGTTTSGTGKPTTAAKAYSTAGTYTILFTITTNKNVSASATAKITVLDVSDPPTEPADPLVVTAPADQTAYTTSGGPVAVTYDAATASGGETPYTFTYYKAGGTLVPPGSLFGVGATTVTAKGRSADGQESTDDFVITVVDIQVPDTIPDAFSFTNITDATVSTVYTSSSITVAGIDTSVTIRVSGGSYNINGGSFTTAAGTVVADDVVTVRLTTPATFSTISSVVLTIGSVAGTYSVTTEAGDTVPDQFSFVAKTEQAVSTEVTSDPVTITGITVASVISIDSFGTYSINGGTFTNADGTVVAGDVVRAKLTSSSGNNITISTTVTIGGIRGTFSVRTVAVTAEAVPAHPSSLTGIYNIPQVRLDWVDNSSNETGFKVERRLSSGSYAQIADLPANTIFFVDSTVLAGNTYLYRVRAYNSVGNSFYTNEVTVVVPAAASNVITVPTGGDFQTALNNAVSGDTIILTAGATYTGNFVLPAKGNANYITIKSSGSIPATGSRVSLGQAGTFPMIQSTTSTPAIRTAAGAQKYKLIGLEIKPNGNAAGTSLLIGDPLATLAANTASDIEIDRCMVRGDATNGQKRGISLHGVRLSVINSYIADYKLVGQDTQAIWGNNGPGPYTIRNNYIEGAGENILFGGDDPRIPNCIPTDVLIENNTITKPLAWKALSWQVKNLLEIKNGANVTIQNNTMSNCWLDAQTGYAVLLTPRNQNGTASWCGLSNVVFQYNTVFNVSGGISLSGEDDLQTSTRTTGITVKYNVFKMNMTDLGGDGIFMKIGRAPQNVIIDNNTTIVDGNKWIYSFTGGAVTTSPNCFFRNNLTLHSTYGFLGVGYALGTPTLAAYYPSYTFTNNVLAGGSTSNYPATTLCPTTGAFQAEFINYAGGDYHLVPGSSFTGLGAYPTPLATNDYFGSLIVRSDLYKQYSLRDQAQLSLYKAANSIPMSVNYIYPNDTDPRKQDAAKIIIPTTTNSLPNQVLLPFGSEDGHTYLTTWDMWYGDECRPPLTGLTNWKAFQFDYPRTVGGRETVWCEVQNRFDGVVSGATDIAAARMRHYPVATTGMTNVDPVAPASGSFIIKPETWTRYWVYMDMPAWPGDMIVTFWAADKNRAAVKLLDGIRWRRDVPGRINKFWIELNTSTDTLVTRPELVMYGKNVVILKDITLPDVTPLLVTTGL